MKPINIIHQLNESATIKPNFTYEEFKKVFEDKYGKGAYYYNDYYGDDCEYAKLTAKDLYDTFIDYSLRNDLYDNSIDGIMQSIEDDLHDMGSNAIIKTQKVNESTWEDKCKHIFNKYRTEFDTINEVRDISDYLNKLYSEGGMSAVDDWFLPGASAEYKKDFKSLINKDKLEESDEDYLKKH